MLTSLVGICYTRKGEALFGAYMLTGQCLRTNMYSQKHVQMLLSVLFISVPDQKSYCPDVL